MEDELVLAKKQRQQIASKKWYNNNKEQHAIACKKWYDTHKDYLKEYRKKYFSNPENKKKKNERDLKNYYDKKLLKTVDSVAESETINFLN